MKHFEQRQDFQPANATRNQIKIHPKTKDKPKLKVVLTPTPKRMVQIGRFVFITT